MKKSGILLSVAAAFMLFAAAPSKPLIRVELSGIRGEITLKESAADSRLKLDSSRALKEKRAFFIRVMGKTDPSGKWTLHEISFTPDKYGEVELCLRGTQTRGNKVVWTWYDKFEIEGANHYNPSFEKISGKTIRQWESYPWHVRAGVSGAPDGKNVGAATHDFSLKQVLSVCKDKKITIRFMARAGETAARPDFNIKSTKKEAMI